MNHRLQQNYVIPHIYLYVLYTQVISHYLIEQYLHKLILNDINEIVITLE